jgi:hypothetical protein
MSKDVVLKLALALQYAYHANFAGTPRQAVADGYSAVDAALSAILAREKSIPLETTSKSLIKFVRRIRTCSRRR